MSVAVSVIVPIFKTPPKYLEACLDSLTTQTLQETEFILVFDGPNERLFKVCKKFQECDKRFKLFIQPHQGVSATRNYGVSQANGVYITFVDADDFIDRNCCKQTFEFAKLNNSDVVLFDFNSTNNQIKAESYTSNSISILSTDDIERLQAESICLTETRFISAVSTWGKIIKKDFFKNHDIKFSTNLIRCVDRPVSYSLFLFGNRVSYLHKCFYNYNRVVGSITNSKYDNIIPAILSYLSEIKKISSKHNSIISNYFAKSFFVYWQNSYFINGTTFREWKKKISLLTNIAKSEWFKDLTNDVNYKSFPKLLQLEMFLFRHSITFPIWLHAIKNKIFHKK